MFIELIRQVRSPAHLKGETGDKMEVSTGDGDTLINGRYAKNVTKHKDKEKDGKTT